MSYQSDIFAAIQADAPLAALIGSRFFWDIADGSVAAPYVVASVISANGETDFAGSRNLTFPLIQLTAWGPGKASLIAIISAIRTAIEGRNLPGSNNVSLGYAGENSTYDSDTKYYGELIEFRASSNTN